VFIIGQPGKPLISIPKGKGLKLSIIEEATAKKSKA
jgi:small subunit ribosomal protein S4e